MWVLFWYFDSRFWILVFDVEFGGLFGILTLYVGLWFGIKIGLDVVICFSVFGFVLVFGFSLGILMLDFDLGPLIFRFGIGCCF